MRAIDRKIQNQTKTTSCDLKSQTKVSDDEHILMIDAPLKTMTAT
jgi:hypothetical protein